MKKRNNKKTGRNIFGEVCTERFLTLDNDNALIQLAGIFDEVTSSDEEIEFTVDCTCFTCGDDEDISDFANRMAKMIFGF